MNGHEIVEHRFTRGTALASIALERRYAAATGMTSFPSPKSRLNSWKEVSAFLGKSERTVRRWEAERGLPVRRLPGAARSSIYVDVEELQAWLDTTVPEPEVDHTPQSSDPAASNRATPWRHPAVFLALAAASVAALALITAFLFLHPPLRPVPDAARRLYAAGTADWARRTPESLNRALDEFNAAIRIAPDYADAYSGLANVYNLMSEYTAMPASESFPLARAAAQHALRLDDKSATAHAALAYAMYWGAWDFAHAEQEYKRALRLDSKNATVEHWYATLLLNRGRYDESLAHIDRALALDPDSISIQADRGLILFYTGQHDAALHGLTALEKANPSFRSPHFYLAYIYSVTGDDPGFVRETLATGRLQGDPALQAVADAAMKGLVEGGHAGMLRAMLAIELDQFHHGTAPAYSVARLYAQLGERKLTIDYLRQSFDRREIFATGAMTDAAFQPLRGDYAFETQIARFHS